MLNRQEKNLMFINSMISIALALVIIIPWSATEVLNAELVVKVWILPIVAIVLFLINLSSKYRNYRPAVRFTTVSAYFPLFSVFASLLSFALLVLVRSNLPYSANTYMFMLAFTAVVLVAMLILSHFFYRAIIVFTKNEMMLIDAPIVLLFLGAMFYVSGICNKYIDLGEPFVNTSAAFIVVPAVIGVAVSTLLVFVLIGLYKGDAEYKVESKKALLEEFMSMHKREYDKAELHILQNLFKYSKGQLGISIAASGVLEKLKAEKAELEAEIERLKEENTKVDGINREKLLELQTRLAELQVVLGEVQVKQEEEKETIEKEKAELKEEKARLEEEKNQLASENTKLEDDRIAFETAKMSYVAPVVKSEEELQQIEDLKAELAKLEMQHDLAVKELNELKAKVEESAGITKAELEEKEAEIARLQEALEQKEAELEALRAEHQSKHEELDELRSTHQEELNKLNAEIKENDDELEKYKAEEAARIAEEERKALEREEALRNKKAKKFKPSYEKIHNFASTLPEKEIRVVPNANGNQHKYYLGKKLFLITLSTSNDYRITFCSDQEKAYPLIVNNPGVVVKATSPKGPEWFKITNKGELDEKLLKNIIKNSAKFIEDQEAARVRAIEEEKARKIAEKEAEKAAQKAEKEAEKAAERAAKEAQKNAEKEAQRKAKEEEERAKREAEEAKEAERLAKEKAKEEERLAKEKEKEAEKKAKEKAKEKERLAKEKAKEKERLAKEKEKAKEKERLAKEKEKEAEKKAKEKAKEKERLAKEKEKAKEKERLAKEKEKAKEKERIAKEKAKEKERLAKEKAKEEEKARKALEKEKAKEEEKARKAAEKAAEKEARKAQEAKELEEAKKIEEAEQAAQAEAETKKAA